MKLLLPYPAISVPSGDVSRFHRLSIPVSVKIPSSCTFHALSIRIPVTHLHDFNIYRLIYRRAAAFKTYSTQSSHIIMTTCSYF